MIIIFESTIINKFYLKTDSRGYTQLLIKSLWNIIQIYFKANFIYLKILNFYLFIQIVDIVILHDKKISWHIWHHVMSLFYYLN